MSQFLALYNNVGNAQFSQMVCMAAPYFSSIAPEFSALKPSYCEVAVKFRREITNHLGTVHAIAMCNAAELVAGTMTDVSIPEGYRWIPKAMSVEYLAKAKTDLRAVADGSQLDWTVQGDIIVPVEIFDTNNVKVFSARITMNVKAGR